MLVLHIRVKMISFHYYLVDLSQRVRYRHSSLAQGSADRPGRIWFVFLFSVWGVILVRRSLSFHFSLENFWNRKIQKPVISMVFWDFRGFRILIEQCECFGLNFSESWLWWVIARMSQFWSRIFRCEKIEKIYPEEKSEDL